MKHGFRVMDSDLHTMEPDGLWETYLEEVLRQVVEAVGDDNIVVSTDYPYSDGLFPHAIEEFVALEGVSDKSKARILWDTCARLYKISGLR
jgi:predicted TIM-barrel fold metal-dependent hydrolase